MLLPPLSMTSAVLMRIRLTGCTASVEASGDMAMKHEKEAAHGRKLGVDLFVLLELRISKESNLSKSSPETRRNMPWMENQRMYSRSE